MSAPIDASVILTIGSGLHALKRSLLSCLWQTGLRSEVLLAAGPETAAEEEALAAVLQRDNPQLRLRVMRGRANALAASQGRYVVLLTSGDAFCGGHVLAQWAQEADALRLEVSTARAFALSPTMLRSPLRRCGLEPCAVRRGAEAPQLANTAHGAQFLFESRFLKAAATALQPQPEPRSDRLFLLDRLLQAERAAASELFAADLAPAAATVPAEAAPLAQYNRALAKLADTLEERRTAGHADADFWRVCAIISLLDLDEYWGQLCLAPEGPGRLREAAAGYLDALRAMVADQGPLYADEAADPAPKDAVLREGRLDLLRLALQGGAEATLAELLGTRRPSLSLLAALRDAGPGGEEAVTRAWSFRRHLPRQTARAVPSALPLPQRVLIHTGLPKTGSSALQQLMERNRFRLLQAGIHYPSFGTSRERGIRRERTPGHAALFQQILDGEAKAVLAGLAAELQEAAEIAGRPLHTLVLSAENIVSRRFWAGGRNFAAMMAPFAGAGRLETAIVLRHPLSWLASYYGELAGNQRNGYTGALAELAQELEAQGLFDCPAILRHLQAPEQVKQLHLGLYEEIRATGGTGTWFLGLLGCSIEGFAEPAKMLRNDSLAPPQVAVIRNLKRLQGLDREQLDFLFLKVLQEGSASRAPVPQMATGLANFRTRHAAALAEFERSYGVAAPEIAAPQPVDLEAAFDRLLPAAARALEPWFRQGRAETEEILKRLDQSYAASNEGRAIRIRRIGRGLFVAAAARAGPARMPSPEGPVQLSRLLWQGEALFAVEGALLERLWQQGQRMATIILRDGTGRHRRSFRILRLVQDGSFWLAPPACLKALGADGLKDYWD